MTDTEIVRLCAEAMESPPTLPGTSDIWGVTVAFVSGERTVRQWVRETYDPLHDDAQCFALVKRFRLQITTPDWTRETWQVKYGQSNFYGIAEVLNRAVCTTVAKMQKAKA